MQHLSWRHLSISAISQQLLPRFGPNFKGRFLVQSLTDTNGHGDICFQAEHFRLKSCLLYLVKNHFILSFSQRSLPEIAWVTIYIRKLRRRFLRNLSSCYWRDDIGLIINKTWKGNSTSSLQLYSNIVITVAITSEIDGDNKLIGDNICQELVEFSNQPNLIVRLAKLMTRHML